MGRRGQSATPHDSNLGGEAFTIWRDLHQKLTELAVLQDRLPPAADDPALLASAPDEGPGSVESLITDTREEISMLELCIERLGILIALREAPPDPPQQVRTAKKRRLEVASNATEPLSGSPASSSLLLEAGTASRTSSPGPLNLPPSHPTRASQAISRASTPVFPEQQQPIRRDTRTGGSITTVTRINSRRTATTTLNRDQLPLLPGRLVAFKRSRKPGEGAHGADPDCWIMARVVRSISNDKNRYEVQDVDMEGSASDPDTSANNSRRRTSWNTTLKSIIPLPVPDRPDTFPSAPLAPGTDVLGLYPDTTTFYLGKIKSGPSEKGRKYRVCFEDDGQTGPLPVAMEHVVALG